MSNYILQTKFFCEIFQKQHAVNNICISDQENLSYGLLSPNGAANPQL
jgi:ABC-type lipopolysaccharide export system ATPase subunit